VKGIYSADIYIHTSNTDCWSIATLSNTNMKCGSPTLLLPLPEEGKKPSAKKKPQQLWLKKSYDTNHMIKKIVERKQTVGRHAYHRTIDSYTRHKDEINLVIINSTKYHLISPEMASEIWCNIIFTHLWRQIRYNNTEWNAYITDFNNNLKTTCHRVAF